MDMRYYIVDAFTKRLFAGTPAGVCLLEEWPQDSVMQSIAAENNLAETAFVLPRGDEYELRWFTPEVEIDLCGHATLASAFVLANYADTHRQRFVFHTKSGALAVEKTGDLFEMDFPSRSPRPVDVTPAMERAIGTGILEALLSRDLLLLVGSERQVQALAPDLAALKSLPDGFGVIVTAKGEHADFVSRFFAPKAGIPEDPVTGSSHASLIPFWSGRLGKAELLARQLSPRGGELYCKDAGDRVKIAGHAVLYLEGSIRSR